MNIVVLDFEIEVSGADPGWWVKDNKISLEGKYFPQSDSITQTVPLELSRKPIPGSEEFLIIGHNLAFDLGWLARTYEEEDFLAWIRSPNVMIWDTMLIEYLLNGQNVCGLSLGLKETCARRGIAKEWDVDFNTVSFEDLKAYNEKDLLNTYALMQRQEADMAPEQLSFIASQMRIQKSTIIASISGIYFDTIKADVEKRLLEMEYLAVRRDIQDIMNSYEPGVTWNPDSPMDIGIILFGGNKTVQEDTPVLDIFGKPAVYKSGIKKGMAKTKRTQRDLVINPMYPGVTAAKTAGGQWKADEEVLKSLDTGFTKKILMMRDIKKQFTTYYESLIKYSDSYDRRIHPQFNHCITATGRLSSSKPNLQNIRGDNGNS